MSHCANDLPNSGGYLGAQRGASFFIRHLQNLATVAMKILPAFAKQALARPEILAEIQVCLRHPVSSLQRGSMLGLGSHHGGLKMDDVMNLLPSRLSSGSASASARSSSDAPQSSAHSGTPRTAEPPLESLPSEAVQVSPLPRKYSKARVSHASDD